MTRECHVRFCERLGVRLPGATSRSERRRALSFYFSKACMGIRSTRESSGCRRRLCRQENVSAALRCETIALPQLAEKCASRLI